MTWDDVAVSYQPQGGAVVTRKLTDADPSFVVTDVPTSEITWTLSIAATRGLPVGSKTKYELQVKNPNGGTGEKVYLFGNDYGKGRAKPRWLIRR
jgi:hypothetical protein